MSADNTRNAPLRAVGGSRAAPGSIRRDERQRLRFDDPRVLAAGVVVLLVIAGALLLVVLANGEPDEVRVPNVIGLPTHEAVEALEDLGLGVDTETVVRDAAEPGMVVAQDPAADSLVLVGSTVRLQVARDADPTPGQVVVPNVVGLSQADALEALGQLGLGADTQPVTREGAEPGTVIAQDPAGGTAVALGSHVRLEVAQEEPAGPNVIAWILSLGPGAPTGPPEFQAYTLLFDRECSTLAQGLVTEGNDLAGLDQEARTLYGAAAYACLAAFEGEADLWAAAQEDLHPLQPPVSCLDVAAYDLLVSLLDAHNRNPEGQFHADTDPSTGYAPPCPTIAALEPDRGPSGTVVRISGTNLDKVERVLIQYDNGDFDDTEQAVLENGSWVLTIDARDDARFACIYVEAATGWNADGMWFAIEASNSPTAPPLDPCPPESQG